MTTPRTAEQGFTGGTVQYGGTFNVYPQNIQPAYVQEWNLTLEYALTRTTSLQVGYSGEQGQHIEDYGNVNQYLVNGDPTSAPFYNNQYLGINAVDPCVSIGSNSLLITESRAMMNYNALQAMLRQRLNHGLEFTVNYTYGKAMTNSLGNYAPERQRLSAAPSRTTTTAPPTTVRPDTTSRTICRAPGSMRCRWARAKNIFPDANRVMDESIGGWKVSAAVSPTRDSRRRFTGPATTPTATATRASTNIAS